MNEIQPLEALSPFRRFGLVLAFLAVILMSWVTAYQAQEIKTYERQNPVEAVNLPADQAEPKDLSSATH